MQWSATNESLSPNQRFGRLLSGPQPLPIRETHGTSVPLTLNPSYLVQHGKSAPTGIAKERVAWLMLESYILSYDEVKLWKRKFSLTILTSFSLSSSISPFKSQWGLRLSYPDEPSGKSKYPGHADKKWVPPGAVDRMKMYVQGHWREEHAWSNKGRAGFKSHMISTPSLPHFFRMHSILRICNPNQRAPPEDPTGRFTLLRLRLKTPRIITDPIGE